MFSTHTYYVYLLLLAVWFAQVLASDDLAKLLGAKVSIESVNETTESTMRLNIYDSAISLFSNQSGGMLVHSERTRLIGGLKENSVLYALLVEAMASGEEELELDCRQALSGFLDGINRKHLWAIKAFDTSGAPRSSFVWGQNAWLGSHRECNYLNRPPKYSLTAALRRTMDSRLVSATAPFAMELRMLFANVTSPNHFDSITIIELPHRLGLCLPSTCSNANVKSLAQSVFDHNVLAFQQLMDIQQVDVLLVRTMRWANFFRRAEVWWIAMSILTVAAFVVGCSMVFDLITTKTPASRVDEFLQCFSMRRNARAMFKTDLAPHSIGSVNGIRTIACVWVLCLHVGYFSIFAYDNVPALFQLLDTMYAQPVFAAIFYVDSFFVISALLSVTNFMRDDKLKEEIRRATWLQNGQLISRLVVHRYVRLTPAFLFTIGVGHLLSVYLQESSSLYVDETFDLYCTADGLWKSLLYVHNMFPVTQMCISWSWYLACDMQFHILLVMILFIYVRHPLIAAGAFTVVTFASGAFCLFELYGLNLTIRIDSAFANIVHIYTVPWMRIGPYMAGAASGFVLHRLKKTTQTKPAISKRLQQTFWTSIGTAFVLTLFVGYDKTIIFGLLFAVVAAFGRHFIGALIGAVTVACALQAGGWFGRFLAAPAFVHLNRLTYFGYLLNPVIVVAVRGAASEGSAHFDVASMLIMVLGVTVITYLASVVCSLLFEVPFQRLSDVYILRKSH